MGHLLMYWCCVCLLSCLVSLALRSLYGCGMIANLLFTALDQVYMKCACCSGVYAAWCTVGTVTMWLYPCWSWLPVVCGQWWQIFLLKSSSGETWWASVVYPVFPFQCCCVAALCWTDFCWQMQLGRGPHCLVLPHVQNSCHPASAINSCQGLCLMHPSPSTMALMHHRISCVYPLWLTT